MASELRKYVLPDGSIVTKKIQPPGATLYVKPMPKKPVKKGK